MSQAQYYNRLLTQSKCFTKSFHSNSGRESVGQVWRTFYPAKKDFSALSEEKIQLDLILQKEFA